MFPTVEARWFYPGPIPPDVLAWYHYSERAPETQPTRIDYYLRLADHDDLSVKLRTGRIEIKQRTEQYGVQPLHEHVHALVEGWCKWGFDIGDINHGASEPGDSPSAWIAVRKTRRLRRYRLADNGDVIAIGGMEYAPQGCHIELAEIAIHEQNWWSLAFETFGPSEVLYTTFMRITQHALRDATAPPLDAACSYGYAQWMKQALERSNIPTTL